MTETALARLEDFKPSEYNVLTPVIHVNRDDPAASEFLVEDVAVVQITEHDTYKPFFAKNDEIALNARGLNKLAAAAGLEIISLDVEERERRPDGHVYVRMRAEVAVRQSNGEYLRRITHKDIDTQDELETFLRQQQKKGKSKAEAERIATDQMLQLRSFLLPHAETKCLNRAIRSVLNLKQTYAKAEIARPFVVPRLLARPDLTAPSIAERSRAGINTVYGPPRELEAGKPGGAVETDGAPSVDEPAPARHNVEGARSGVGDRAKATPSATVAAEVAGNSPSPSAARNVEPDRGPRGEAREAVGPPDQPEARDDAGAVFAKTHKPRGNRSTAGASQPLSAPADNSEPTAGTAAPETAPASLPEEPCAKFIGDGSVDFAGCENCGWPISSHNRQVTL